jgi:hypothetical protein
MFKTIKRPADCEVQSVIRFLNARNVKPADIHRQICEVYGENAMSDDGEEMGQTVKFRSWERAW